MVTTATRTLCPRRPLGSLGRFLAGLEVLEDAHGYLSVLPDLIQDGQGALSRGVSFCIGMLERQAILLGLAVTGEQDHRTRIGGLDAEQLVEKDERVRVPAADEADDVQDDPDGDDDRLGDKERPGPDDACDPVRHTFTERRLVVVNDVDRVRVMTPALAAPTNLERATAIGP
jgi:hypothetical protein